MSERSLGSLLECLIDYRGKTPPKSADGIKLITARVIKDGAIEQARLEYISQATYETWMRRGFPKRGDILITTEAPLGEVAQLRTDERVALAQRVILLRPDASKVDPQYLFHFLRSPLARQRLRQRASGTTVSGIRQPELRAVTISLPDRPAQSRIGAILDRIDDLIENNRRRIALLERMARAIYREWFVHFRYPGHEDDELVDSCLGSIPEGWTTPRVGEVATIVRGRSYRRPELVDEGGVAFINLKCMERGGGFRHDGLKRYAGPFKPEQVAASGDIVLAVTDLTQGREILARATLVPRLPEGKGVISLDVARVVPSHSDDRLSLFVVLRHSDLADRVKEFANGSTVLHLSPDHIGAAEIVWPSRIVRRQLNRLLEPSFALIEELSGAAGQLHDLRDSLLPKLVTGAIDVSSLDLEALLAEEEETAA